MCVYLGSPTVSTVLVLSPYTVDIIHLKNIELFQVQIQGTVPVIGRATDYVFIE